MKAKSRQTLIDVLLENVGNLDKIVSVSKENNISLTQDLTDVEIQLPPAEQKAVVFALKTRGIATGLTEQPNTDDLGIGTMIISQNFTIWPEV